MHRRPEADLAYHPEIVDTRVQLTRQLQKWGVQSHPCVPERDGREDWEYAYDLGVREEEEVKGMCEAERGWGTMTWFHKLYEELVEALFAKTPEERYKEVIQCAAVAVAWAECMHRTGLVEPTKYDENNL